MGYLVPPPPRSGLALRREWEQKYGGVCVLYQGPAKLDPPRYPASDALLAGYPPDRSASGIIPGRPGQSVGTTLDPLGALCDALAALLPFPTLPTPLTDDYREAWPNVYGDEVE